MIDEVIFNFNRTAFIPSWIKIVLKDKVEEIFETIEFRLNNLVIKKGGITLSIPYVSIDAVKK
jgi:hypothetical protein